MSSTHCVTAIDALDPDLISSVLLADADGQHLWPAAGRRVPEDYKQLITPLSLIATAGVVVVTLVVALSGVDVAKCLVILMLAPAVAYRFTAGLTRKAAQDCPAGARR